MIKKYGFTLAELLIAMFIFAIIAVMLLPKLTLNAEKELFATQTKKVQNDIQQAMLVMLARNSGTFIGAYTNNESFRDAIADLLETKVKFGAATAANEIDENDELNSVKQKNLYKEKEPIFMDKKTDAEFDINDPDSFVALNLKNGATVSLKFDAACNTKYFSENIGESTIKTCGYIEVDVNAAKAPNMVGKDIHYFWIIDKDGIIPFGEVDNFTCGTFNETENSWTIKPAKSADIKKSSLGCTYRLMNRGSIDYY